MISVECNVKLSTGQRTLRSRCFLSFTSTTFTGLGLPFSYPPRKPAISSIGACVAESPILTGLVSIISASLSTDKDKCVPRLLLARSCISSRIMYLVCLK